MPENIARPPTAQERSRKRPLTVAVVAWFFILWAIITAIPKAFLVLDTEAYQLASEFNQLLSNNSLLNIPFWFQLAHAFVGFFVLIISGIYMLKGRMWSLIVFFCWIYGVVLLTYLTSGLSISFYTKLTVVIVITLLLTQPKTVSFFR